VRILCHSDGYFEPIVGDLMEFGVDAINPLQPKYMDVASIQRRFGPRLAFWGTVGRQTASSFAKPEEIRLDLNERIETLDRAGLAMCPAHDIDEPVVPWQNIIALESYGKG
jgi:uroporphyrinogen decarboxylase